MSHINHLSRDVYFLQHCIKTIRHGGEFITISFSFYDASIKQVSDIKKIIDVVEILIDNFSLPFLSMKNAILSVP